MVLEHVVSTLKSEHFESTSIMVSKHFIVTGEPVVDTGFPVGTKAVRKASGSVGAHQNRARDRSSGF